MFRKAAPMGTRNLLQLHHPPDRALDTAAPNQSLGYSSHRLRWRKICTVAGKTTRSQNRVELQHVPSDRAERGVTSVANIAYPRSPRICIFQLSWSLHAVSWMMHVDPSCLR